MEDLIERNNPFAVKLTMRERCAIYALHHHKHVSLSTLAKAFGVGQGTVSRMCSSISRQYSDVKRVAQNMGLEDMFWKYVNEEDIRRCNSATHRTNAKPIGRSLDIPSYAHNKNQGEYFVRRSDGTHLLCIIDWRDDQPDGPGWYYRMPNHPQFADAWLISNDTEKPFLTSTGAKNYLIKEYGN